MTCPVEIEIEVVCPQPIEIEFQPMVYIGGGGQPPYAVSETAPPPPAGDLGFWYRSTDGTLFVFYDGFWVQVSGSDGLPGDPGAGLIGYSQLFLL